MDNKERQQIQAESDRHWAEMRDNQTALLGILTMRKPSELDVLWSMGCIGLVHNDLLLYKYDIGEEGVEQAINEYKDCTNDVMKSFLEDVGKLQKIGDNTVKIEEKQSIIENMRRKMWNGILREDDRLGYLMTNFGSIRDEMDLMLIYKCVSLVCFELKIRDLEIQILEGEF